MVKDGGKKGRKGGVLKGGGVPFGNCNGGGLGECRASAR